MDFLGSLDSLHASLLMKWRDRIRKAHIDALYDEWGMDGKIHSRSWALESALGIDGVCGWLGRSMWLIRNH